MRHERRLLVVAGQSLFVVARRGHLCTRRLRSSIGVGRAGLFGVLTLLVRCRRRNDALRVQIATIRGKNVSSSIATTTRRLEANVDGGRRGRDD